MKKQAFNPFLPLDEYVPDGEPHVFGDRVYLYGSHDKEGGNTFCMLDYVVYSASVYDLKNWRYEGVSYSAKQDPLYRKDNCYLYAPDVVKGNDNRYYLYYCLAWKSGVTGYLNPVSVAVSDSPAGKFEYLGVVKDKDGKPYKEHLMFDPAVINDDGIIRLYSGTRLTLHEMDFKNEQEKTQMNEWLQKLFGMSDLTVDNLGELYGAFTCTLGEDMMTMTSDMTRITPIYSKGTCWETHPFFEASSIRKINGKYYYIYSSSFGHELCYAVSDYPDRDFVCKGVIVSNADVGYEGRTQENALNYLSNNHGSIEKINGKWYVFYHRHTNATSFSRQACAEQIEILPDGTIPQVRITSCGLNGGPLTASGEYPAVIACIVCGGKTRNEKTGKPRRGIAKITSRKNERFVSHISDGCIIGFRDFLFDKDTVLNLKMRGTIKGKLTISDDKRKIAEVDVECDSLSWKTITMPITLRGVHSLYIKYTGKGRFDLLSLKFN